MLFAVNHYRKREKPGFTVCAIPRSAQLWRIVAGWLIGNSIRLAGSKTP